MFGMRFNGWIQERWYVLLHFGFLGGTGEGGKGSYVGFWFWGIEFSLGVVEQEFGFGLRY